MILEPMPCQGPPCVLPRECARVGICAIHSAAWSWWEKLGETGRREVVDLLGPTETIAGAFLKLEMEEKGR